jgi:hypothetical protein
MILQILWVQWDGIRFEIPGRTDDRETHIFGDSNCDHVSMNELADLDTGIVLSSDKIDRIAGTGYLQDDVRIPTNELH